LIRVIGGSLFCPHLPHSALTIFDVFLPMAAIAGSAPPA